jgi:hypothetical protein
LRIEISLAAIDRRTGEPCDFRNGRKTPSTCRLDLGCRKQTPPALVEPRADAVPAQPDEGTLNGERVQD